MMMTAIKCDGGGDTHPRLGQESGLESKSIFPFFVFGVVSERASRAAYGKILGRLVGTTYEISLESSTQYHLNVLCIQIIHPLLPVFF